MANSIDTGSIECNFLSRVEFIELCKKWLKSSQYHHIVTLNPEMVVEASRNASFAKDVKNAEIRVPDGAGLWWARQYLNSSQHFLKSLLSFPFTNAPRVTGVDAITDICRLCADSGQGVYLLGGDSAEAKMTAQKLQKAFPSLSLHASAPHTYCEDGPQEIVDHINAIKPAVLLVSYGAVKQAHWIEQRRHVLPSVRTAIGVGGAFAMISGHKPRAPLWLRHCNMEWLWRLILEPSRISRIYSAIVEFPRLVQKQKRKS